MALRFGQCKAEFFKVEGETRKSLWSRSLINNEAPVRVYVADSGRYVVTMDEWHNVGDLPVVIYGVNGSLNYVHNQESLKLDRDIQQIKVTVSSFWWNEDSLVFFSSDSEILFIRLHWGRLLMIDLHGGEVMDDEWYEEYKDRRMKPERWRSLHDYAAKMTATLALGHLESSNADERRTGAKAAGQIKLNAALPKLKELLSDENHHVQINNSKSTKVYYVREAAEEAIRKIEGHPATNPSTRESE